MSLDHSDPAAQPRRSMTTPRPGVKLRTYGNTGTIHGSTELDIEVDDRGQVVAVWFRCQTLPFRQANPGPERSADMREAYKRGTVKLHAVVVQDE